MKKVAFICYANACRSQIAEGLSKLYGKGLYKAYSAGLCPLSMIAGGVYEVMDKRGIDISDQYSKGLEEIPIAVMDFVISLASFPADIVCPRDFAGNKLDWNIPDPYGASMDEYEKITNVIEDKLKKFIEKNFK